MAISERIVTLTPAQIRTSMDRDLADPAYMAIIREGLAEADTYIESLKAPKGS